MTRSVFPFLIAIPAFLGLLTACSRSDEAGSPPAIAEIAHDQTIGSLKAEPPGARVYAQSCVACHDTGVAGAPAIGDQSAWSERSRLWTAVLSEHAKQGYLTMPAKGGAEGLTEAAVAAACEYMLSETYPELPSSD
ncbi:MAG: c-type cytochrome [Gammaproteobacteria bacterium]|nr:c-type cytochrome [Gammaproteobacteria bacterium]